MASGIFAILDDVALLLDDAAALSKVAARKTAGLLGDDLAVNAEKATGVHASRELPVIWAITKGSLLNKAIILPAAFLLSAYLPWLVVPILLLGGAYLSYEGFEKVLEWIFPHPPSKVAAAATSLTPEQLVEHDASKIKGAVRTDFILSIEIIVIALETVIAESLPLQIIVVSAIALLATVGVYGLVALLVRMDDTGMYLIAWSKTLSGFFARTMRLSGHALVAALPKVVRLLGVVGTIAMLLVGGGMFVHNIHWVHDVFQALPALIGELLTGLVVGALILGSLHLIKRARSAFSQA